MWFIGFEVEQETSAPPPKKNPGSALEIGWSIPFIPSTRWKERHSLVKSEWDTVSVPVRLQSVEITMNCWKSLFLAFISCFLTVHGKYIFLFGFNHDAWTVTNVMNILTRRNRCTSLRVFRVEKTENWVLAATFQCQFKVFFFWRLWRG